MDEGCTVASWFETAQERLLTMKQCNDGAPRIVRVADCAEPVIGRRFAPTRWLHPGYSLSTRTRSGFSDLPVGQFVDGAVESYF
jgi:hypothetical protein